MNNNAIFSLSAVPNDPQNRLVTSSGDKNLILFDPESECDPKTHQPLSYEQFDGHIGSVKCSDFQTDSSSMCHVNAQILSY